MSAVTVGFASGLVGAFLGYVGMRALIGWLGMNWAMGSFAIIVVVAAASLYAFLENY